jgi:hypothetical protein
MGGRPLGGVDTAMIRGPGGRPCPMKPIIAPTGRIYMHMQRLSTPSLSLYLSRYYI